MSFIRFGKIDKTIIPIILGCIFCFLNRILNTYKGTILFDHMIIANIFVASSKLFAIIPYAIYKIRTKKNHSYINNLERISISNGSAKLYHENVKKKRIREKWIFIIISAIIFFAQFLIFIYTVKMKTNFWVWDILFVLLLCYLILKIKFYKHHYLSLVLIILTGLIIDFVYERIQKDISENLTQFLLRFLREILLSLHEIVNKYIIEKKNGSIYEICLFNGFINLILFLFFSLLSYYYFKLDDFNEYFSNFNLTELLVALGVIITQLGFYLFALITNKNYTPCHVFIIFAFGQLAFFINFNTESIITFICFIFILFISLIFNEIIELNFCGLSDNVKRNIIYRAKNEDFEVDSNYRIDTLDEDYSFDFYLPDDKDYEEME